MYPARLGTAGPEPLILPVEIIQAQAADFACSKTVSNEQHENRAVTLVNRPVALRGGQEAQDILPFQPPRHRVAPHETRAMIPLAMPGRHQPRASAKRKKARRRWA